MTRAQELRAFAQTWLQRDLESTDCIAVPKELAIPAALREIYELFGAVPQLTQPHNRLLPPASIESVDGYSIFYDENQGVVRWAFHEEDQAQEDPVVHQGTTLPGGYEWYSEEMPLSRWVRVMSLWQLVNGGYEFVAYSSGVAGATQVVEKALPKVEGHADGSTRFHGGPGRLICLAGPSTIPSVLAAGATQNDLKWLSSNLGFEWDYSSEDDD